MLGVVETVCFKILTVKNKDFLNKFYGQAPQLFSNDVTKRVPKKCTSLKRTFNNSIKIKNVYVIFLGNKKNIGYLSKCLVSAVGSASVS